MCLGAYERELFQRKFRAATLFQSVVRLFLARQRITPVVERARIAKEVQWAKDSRICFRIQKKWRSNRYATAVH